MSTGSSSRETQCSQVLALIREHGGLSMKEVARIMGVGFNRVSGRGTELKSAGLVRRNGQSRDGSAVLVSI